MKFIVDNMLGKLARYLRFLGYDTYYSNSTIKDDEIIEIASREKRILITRDKELASRYKNSFLLRTTDSKEQLKEVIKKFNLGNSKILTRCSICNVELIRINKEQAKGKVPEKIYENFNEFYICPSCGRYYWLGTHAMNIENMIKMVEKDEN